MAYSNKILLASGCSHTAGTFLGDTLSDQSRNRSWVNKLAVKMGFKNSVNLSRPGSSNKRSIRTITEYILNDIENAHNYVVFIGLTELARSEVPTELSELSLPMDTTFDSDKNGYNIYMLNPFNIGKLEEKKLNDFLDVYFGYFSVDKYLLNELHQNLLHLRYFFEAYGIEFYCPIIMGRASDYCENVKNISLPFIKFEHWGAVEYARKNGFKIGSEIDQTYNCAHLDHDGNEFIADYIYGYMLKNKD